MKLNLGCGHRRIDGWLNVDSSPLCQPDQVVDLEVLPWPWPDNSAEEVLLQHVLEHLAPQASTYLALMKELWRVCRPGAEITIVVPHPRHDDFLGDPTHVRPITPHSLALFSQQSNRRAIENNWANTPLGLMLGIDLETVQTRYVLDEPWRSALAKGEMTQDQITHAMRTYYNVIKEVTIRLRAVKPETAEGA